MDRHATEMYNFLIGKSVNVFMEDYIVPNVSGKYKIEVDESCKEEALRIAEFANKALGENKTLLFRAYHSLCSGPTSGETRLSLKVGATFDTMEMAYKNCRKYGENEFFGEGITFTVSLEEDGI